MKFALTLTLVLLTAAGALLFVPGSSASSAGDRVSADCGAPCWIHVAFQGSGSGRVVATWQESGPMTQTCFAGDPDCLVKTDFGVTITFTATADSGSYFVSMVGDGCQEPSEPSCTYFMDFERHLDLTFGGVGQPPPPPSPPPPPPPPLPPPSSPPPPPPPPPADDLPAGCTIVGTSGDDELNATTNDDVICGLGGDDHIHAGGGQDEVYAGAGDDEIELGAGYNHTVYGGPGNDRVFGGHGNDRIFGGSGNEVIDGGSGHDIIRGGPGNDVLHGQSGADLINGDAGNDRIWGGPGRDRLYGGAGRDKIRAIDKYVDTVLGGPGADLAYVDQFDRMRLVERHRHR